MRYLSNGRALARSTVGFLIIGGALLAVAAVASAFEPLPRTTPESVGIDSVRLKEVLGELERVDGARSVVVVHRGMVVDEAYWSGSETTLHHVRSVTKSVTSTLIGIAVDRGFIDGVDARMVDYLPHDLRPSDPAKDAILLRHLLNHTAGFQWDENGEFSAWSTSQDPARYILDRPLATTPGSAFRYSTAATHLLSVVLSEATGMSTVDFANAFLFSDLGVSDLRWGRDRQGYRFGGHGLQLRTEDMAKLGLLFLDRGRWGDDEVVSAEWVSAATGIQFEGGSDYEPLQAVHYGFLWWLAHADGLSVFIGWGWGGQFVFCVPVLDLVVAVNARWQVNEPQASAQEVAILEVIVDKLLPLIPVRHRSPRRPLRRLLPNAPGLLSSPIWLRSAPPGRVWDLPGFRRGDVLYRRPDTVLQSITCQSFLATITTREAPPPRSRLMRRP